MSGERIIRPGARAVLVADVRYYPAGERSAAMPAGTAVQVDHDGFVGGILRVVVVAVEGELRGRVAVVWPADLRMEMEP